MIKVIQIIALLQGLFVLVVLLFKRKEYEKITFWLFFASLLSVFIYILGDDEHNIFIKGADWFMFDSSLFVTFFFLFIRYTKNVKENFNKFDYIFFLPNIIYFIIEGIELKLNQDNLIVEIVEVIVELIFVAYLLIIVKSVLTVKSKHWIIYFALPIAMLFIYSGLNDFIMALGYAELPLFDNQNFNTYILLIVAFLFYFIAFKLLQKENHVLPKRENDKYRNSSLNPQLIEDYKSRLITCMEVDMLFLNNKLSIHDVSKHVNIPRQYISEVLNVHMNVNFQDFVNGYRVEEFIDRLRKDQNEHYTLLAIATDVGFSSKSSFNATFKKFKGLTPSEFKKNYNAKNKRV